MPHHWTPVGPNPASQGMEKPPDNVKYRGGDGELVWELREISLEEAERLREEPRRHDCERILNDNYKKC
jgi:hypothetical protein